MKIYPSEMVLGILGPGQFGLGQMGTGQLGPRHLGPGSNCSGAGGDFFCVDSTLLRGSPYSLFHDYPGPNCPEPICVGPNLPETR